MGETNAGSPHLSFGELFTRQGTLISIFVKRYIHYIPTYLGILSKSYIWVVDI